MSEYAGTQFIGIDLHRRLSVLVRTTDVGEVLERVRISNDVDYLAAVMARAGESAEVVLEASQADCRADSKNVISSSATDSGASTGAK